MLVSGLLQIAEFLSDRPDRIVDQQQDWGLLGLDTCAHAPGQTPLPLRIGTRDYAKGLGAHANGEIVVELDDDCERFEAEVGVQRQQGTVGSVVFHVFVDDVERFTSATMHESDEAVPVSIALAGAQELRLVASDAGDGITCDCADWAAARLIRNERAAAESGAAASHRARRGSIDLAPFASVRSWDWRAMQGTRAGRLDEFPAADLFPWVEPPRGADGAWSVAVQEGAACVGLEWLERRRIARLELCIVGEPPAAESLRVEQWIQGAGGGSQGGSTWQGRWEPLHSSVRRDGDRFVLEPAIDDGAIVMSGTTKIRWVVPSSAAELRVLELRAASRSRFREVELELSSTERGPATVTVWNGERRDGAATTALTTSPPTAPLQWDRAQPLRLALAACSSRHARGDRTLVRVALLTGTVGIAVEDVLAQGGVWIPEAGLYVTDAQKPLPLAEFRARFAGKRTILDEVRARPDQTLDAAMARLHSDRQELGPTLLSLPLDPRKFQLERDGTLRWDDRPEVFASIDVVPASAWRCACVVRFGEEQSPATERELADLSCFELELRQRRDAVRSSLRALVAPVASPGAATPSAIAELLQAPAVGQLLLTAENLGESPAPALFDVSFAHPSGVRVELIPDGPASILDGEGRVLAWIDRVADATRGASLESTPPTAIVPTSGGCTLRATLAPHARAQWRVLLPRWNAAPAELARVADVESLRGNARAAWQLLLGEMTQVELPDPALDRLLHASLLHCLVAARGTTVAGSDPLRIAPWIASVHYGPLESEAQAVVRGMQSLGGRTFAAAAHRYFADRVDPQGRLTTGYTLLGLGWWLWTLAEFDARFADDETLRAVAPAVVRGCRWITAQRSKSMRVDARGERLPAWGLMPPGPLADWDVDAFYFYANANYCKGMGDAAVALARIGDPAAAEIAADAAAYRDDLLRAYRWARERAPVVALRDGRSVPYYPTQLFAHGPVGDLYPGEDAGRSWCYDVELGAAHLIALGFLAPRSREADAIVEHLEDVQFLRDGWFAYPAAANERDWFDCGGFAKVQPYYARTVECHAARDDVAPFLRSYFNTIPTLLNREDLSFWEHFAASGAWNKTHETGYFLGQTRTLLLDERGDELWLLPFAPRAWLEDGKSIAVRHAPTRFGPVSFRVTSHLADGWIDVTIDAPAAGAGTGTRPRLKEFVLRLRLPDGGQLAPDPTSELVRIAPPSAGGATTIVRRVNLARR